MPSIVSLAAAQSAPARRRGQQFSAASPALTAFGGGRQLPRPPLKGGASSGLRPPFSTATAVWNVDPALSNWRVPPSTQLRHPASIYRNPGVSMEVRPLSAVRWKAVVSSAVFFRSAGVLGVLQGPHVPATQPPAAKCRRGGRSRRDWPAPRWCRGATPRQAPETGGPRWWP